jgi:hypothetical protein
LFINTPQAAEVMLYTVDKVNSLGVLPPPLKLGAYVLDDCDKDTYGLQQAVDFIKGKKNVVSFFINFFSYQSCSIFNSYHKVSFGYQKASSTV